MEKISGVSDEYYAYLNMITRLFGEEWKEVQDFVSEKNLSAKSLNTLFYEVVPLMYRRWYFSALAEESLLSPANLVLSLNRAYGVPEHVTPRFTLKPDENGNLQPKYELTSFEAEKHPVIGDLKHFLSNIGQTFDTTAPEEWNVPELSLYGCEYRIFIYNVAKHLKLVRDMPSVTNVIGMVAGNWESFFDNDERAILEKVVNAVLDECIDAIREILPIRKIYKQRLYGYLKNPMTTDHIFSEIFSDTGVDILDFIENIDDELASSEGEMEDILAGLFSDDTEQERTLSPAGVQASLMTGAFLLGLILDRHFFTPFAYYCRLIQPLFILPYKVKDELGGLLDFLSRLEKTPMPADLNIHKEISSHVCAPCTAYCLTDIGMEIIKEKRSTENVLLPQDAPITQIIASIKEITALSGKEDAYADVVTVKITPKDEKTYWQNVELPSNIPLGGLHVFFSLIFGFDPSADCSFFPGTAENPFTEYTSRAPKAKSGRTARAMKNKEAQMLTRFGNILPKEPEDKMLYIIHAKAGKVCFELKIMKTEQKKVTNLPRVVRRGKGFTEE